MSAKNTSKRFITKFHVKTGDKVVVISGDDKGKTGIISEIITTKSRAIVEGLNIVKKHVKATQTQEGGIQNVAAPIHISNLSLIDPKSGKATRVGRKEVNGKSVRFSKSTGEIIK
jgi:large subunit ribosomal protein L24